MGVIFAPYKNTTIPAVALLAFLAKLEADCLLEMRRYCYICSN